MSEPRAKYLPQRQVKERKKPTHIESGIQIACVNWFALQFPALSDLLHSIPNEGKRTKAVGGIMKAQGLRRGCPDLKLAVARGGYHGLYIEMKKPGKSSRPDQVAYQKRLIEQGYAVAECQTLDEFIADVTGYLCS